MYGKNETRGLVEGCDSYIRNEHGLDPAGVKGGGEMERKTSSLM